MEQAYLSGNENGVSVSLRDSLRFVTKPLEDFYKTTFKTSTEPLQQFCRETTTPLQHSYQERATALQDALQQMIEYLNFILLCTLVVLLRTVTFYRRKEMAEASFTDLLPEISYDPPKSDAKRQKLIECIVTGNSKQYPGKGYTEERINELSEEEVDKLLIFISLFFLSSIKQRS